MAKSPGWRDDALDLIRGHTDDIDRRAALVVTLRRARQLRPPLHQPWRDVAVDWLIDLERRSSLNAQEGRLHSLQALLDTGLNPNGGAAVFSHLSGSKLSEATMEYFRLQHANPRKNDQAARVSAGIVRGLADNASAHRSSWLARTCWAGREAPNLPVLVQCLIDRGGDPNHTGDSESAWSAWPSALCTGRIDLLETLAQACAGQRPVDWAAAVGALLEYVSSDSSSRSRKPDLFKALEWFVSTYPPSKADCAEVWQHLVESQKVKFSKGMLLWLSLPEAGWEEPDGLHGMPESTNPWAALAEVEAGMEPWARRVLASLLAHPHWGQVEALQSCPIEHTSYSATLPLGANLVTAWLVEDEPSKPAAGYLPWRRALMAAINGLGASADASLAEALAWKKDAPDTATEEWLLSHVHQWADPWRFGPAFEPMRRWLAQHAPPAEGSSLAAAAAAFAQRPNGAGAESLRPFLTSPDLDWTCRAEGWTLAGWVAALPQLNDMAPRKGRMLSVPAVDILGASLGVASLTDLRTALKRALADRDPACFSAEESGRLLAHWIGTDAPSSRRPNWRYNAENGCIGTEESIDDRRATLALLAPYLRPTAAHVSADLFAKAWERFSSTNPHERTDLMPLLDVLVSARCEWSSASAAALARWGWSLLERESWGTTTDPVTEVWDSSGWKGLDLSFRAATGRAMLKFAAAWAHACGTNASVQIEMVLRRIDGACFNNDPAQAVQDLSVAEAQKWLIWWRNKNTEKIRRGRPMALAWEAACAQKALDSHLIQPIAAPPRRFRM